MRPLRSVLLLAALAAVCTADELPVPAGAIPLEGAASIVIDDMVYRAPPGATHYTSEVQFRVDERAPLETGVSYQPIEGQRKIDGVPVPKGAQFYWRRVRFHPLHVFPPPAPLPLPGQAAEGKGLAGRTQELLGEGSRPAAGVTCDENGVCRPVAEAPAAPVAKEKKTVCLPDGRCVEVECDDAGVCRPVARPKDKKTVCLPDGRCIEVECDDAGVCRPVAKPKDKKTVCLPDGRCIEVECDDAGVCRPVAGPAAAAPRAPGRTVKTIVGPDGASRRWECDENGVCRPLAEDGAAAGGKKTIKTICGPDGVCRQYECDERGACRLIDRPLGSEPTTPRPPAAPTASAPTASAPTASAPRTPYQQALERARAEGKLVLLQFTAGWCGWCPRQEAALRSSPVASLLAGRFVVVKVDFDRHKPLVNKYRVSGLPDLRVITPDEAQLAGHSGYQDPTRLQAFLQGALRGR